MDKIEKKVYTVDEITIMLDIGKRQAYELVKKNIFSTRKLGRKILISKKSFDEWLNGTQDEIDDKVQ